jgi:hypothetical protein
LTDVIVVSDVNDCITAAVIVAVVAGDVIMFIDEVASVVCMNVSVVLIIVTIAVELSQYG